MKARWWWAAGAAVVVAGSVGAWAYRTQLVVLAASDPQVLALLDREPAQLRAASGMLPWDQGDVVLAWRDDWTAPGPAVQELSGSPEGLVAYDLFAVVGRRGGVPKSWAEWQAELDRPGAPALVAPGRTDAELLTTVLWFADLVLAPEALTASFQTLSQDPSAGLEAGVLKPDHPWYSAVQEIRRWTKAGRLFPQWWDYGSSDVVAAVRDGQVRWGLAWSSDHRALSQDGVPLTSLSPVPVRPDRHSGTVVGRWLVGTSGHGWGDPNRALRVLRGLQRSDVADRWLKEKGLLLAGNSLPPVDQESKELALALPRAGVLIASPAPSSDLSRWKPLISALRAALHP